MAIRRACTYTASIKTPNDPITYSKILITLSQNQEIIVEKNKSDLELETNAVGFTLTQEETKLFRPSIKSPKGARVGTPAYIQIRVYKNENDAPGSDCWEVDVYDSLNDEVLTDE